MSWAWFEKLPFVGSYMTIFRQIYDYLYAIVVLTKWTFTREFFLPPHLELNLSDCSAFSGKTAVLTGGTRGIGAGIVKKTTANQCEHNNWVPKSEGWRKTGKFHKTARS
jgi:hypothetical protein